jgi:DNA polymerase I
VAVKTALIDADTLVYEASLASEQPIEWGDDMWTLHASMAEARFRFDNLVDAIKEATGADTLVLALSDGDNSARWRNRVMPTYKSNRKRVRRPVCYLPLRAYCHENYTTFERPTLEGDDVLGILMTHPRLVVGEKVLVAIDKDMRTIPGQHYNYTKQEHFTVDPAEARFNHMMQTLTGDATDGYPGCPGIGKVRAERILIGEDGGPLWPRVVEAYEKAGLSEEVALMNARVARICHHTDYDFNKKEVILWHPGS